MKKIFTLIVMSVMALGAFAMQYDLGNPTNNAGDGWFDEATKKITFIEAGSYRPGWWLDWYNGGNNGQDFSAYDRIVVELADIQNCGTISVYFEYHAEGIEQAIVTVDPTTGKAIINLDAEGKKAVKQMYLQATEAGGTCTFVAAYAENDESAPTNVNIFEGPTTVPLGWDDSNRVSGTLNDIAKSLLKVGNYIGIEYACEPYPDNENDRYYQVQFMGAWWTLLEGAIGTNGAEKVTEGGNSNLIINLNAEETIVEFKLTEGDIATLNQQNGVLLTGHGIYVKRIYISQESQATSSTPASADKKLWDLATWENVDVTAEVTVDGLTYYGEAKSAFSSGNATFTKGEDLTYKCTGRIKMGGASTFKEGSFSRVFAFDVKKGQNIIVFGTHGSSSGDPRTFYLSQKTSTTKNDVETAFASKSFEPGEKAYFEGVAPEDGTVYLWADNNNGVYTIAVGYTFEELAAGASGVNAITIEKAKNNIRYNLAGQRVDESCKGVVIMNDKKCEVK